MCGRGRGIPPRRTLLPCDDRAGSTRQRLQISSAGSKGFDLFAGKGNIFPEAYQCGEGTIGLNDHARAIDVTTPPGIVSRSSQVPTPFFDRLVRRQ